MRTIITKMAGCLLMLCITTLAQAQQADSGQRQLLAQGVEFFVPNWQVGGQLGFAHDLGEGSFTELISPALQLAAEYQFHPAYSVRMGLSGLWARNKYNVLDLDRTFIYKWNFVQPAVDLKADLTTLYAGWDPERQFQTYVFVGLGMALSFGNGDAEHENRSIFVNFQKLWTGSRLNPVVRGGLGGEYRLNEQWALTAEANINMLPDHFNSKEGHDNNQDWHFNALVGAKMYLGRTHGRTDNVYGGPTAIQYVQPTYELPQLVADSVAMTINVQFELNKWDIRPSEQDKLVDLAIYMHEHPQAVVNVTGYADRETGNSSINDRLSQERAFAVAGFLVGRGVSSERIRQFAKGDRVQPFSTPEFNRVTICIVTDR